MISFDHGKTRFHCRVGGVALHNGRVLLNRFEDADFWFLPGGRAEFDETSHESLIREMREELNEQASIERLLWIAENFFQDGERTFQELGLYFLISFPSSSSVYQQEAFLGYEKDVHLIYRWFPLDQVPALNLKPDFLRKTLLELPEAPVHLIVRD
ncbi:ADP-ribose pyrophosphatase YjhB (NUDIX family) [Thermosporothrix hazakensis]|jgi:8-oxo-dGTP pyrophosphatase MutT (NUDIX family)|uniref:ADP-ribose pyrophosphatase YjhB (NUDIX family) n=2 Tax=Thermosporothrix TaxID=768650 RepID=A0A326U625_THEHA|nr:NUDIX domain-containing protein [Thermosporothrix hazakensis]PZW27482.1 ADP-ribose pyrophosphatase YjhB (NUDIX family) [Thermosporothrix hazakensis]BBH85925.1 DNA mismatch repair protein MutT [Thermosporothrix sp. COM3]